MKILKQIGRYSKYAGAGLGIGALILATFAFAQNTGNTGNLLISPKPKISANFSTTTAKQKLEAAEQRRIKAIQNIATSTIKQKFEEVQNRASQTMQNLEKIREQAQVKIKQVKEKLEEKMNEIRDKQKQKMAQQIANHFDRLNKVWTDHFLQLLNRYSVILEKIKTRADKAAANGQDVSEVDTAIQTAETAISNARQAVEAQAKKTYTIDLTAVNSGIATTTTAIGQNQLIINLRAQFKTLRDQLKKDLFDLRDGLMKGARSAVHNALQLLSKIPKVNEEPVATSTPQS